MSEMQGRGKKKNPADCICRNTSQRLSRETPKQVTNAAGEMCRNPRVVQITLKLMAMTKASRTRGWGGGSPGRAQKQSCNVTHRRLMCAGTSSRLDTGTELLQHKRFKMFAKLFSTIHTRFLKDTSEYSWDTGDLACVLGFFRNIP